jgi:hypothetical protein
VDGRGTGAALGGLAVVLTAGRRFSWLLVFIFRSVVAEQDSQKLQGTPHP